MFYEFNTTSREGWKYPYKGRELLDGAKFVLDSYREAEMKARNELADMMRDPNVKQSDERIAKLKRDIEHNGQQYEACCVVVSGFEREPEREFLLSVGDVVYFGLHYKAVGASS